jgi:beta-1,4-mannosyl-glycoprotein beta-1,4-N-acetylglucosaminyltransferase
MLDIRFKELYDVVDKFFIVESEETFTGIKKPLYLSECVKEKYPQYLDKIDIIVAPSKNFWSAWDREYFQKNHICKENLAYLDLNDDDLILFSDADEIPKKSTILNMIKNGYDKSGGGIGGNTYYYKFNFQTTELSHRPRYISYKNFTNHTEQRYDFSPEILPEAGWHFSYIKNAESIKNKIKAFSHQEFNNDLINNEDLINQKISTMSDLFNRPDIKLTKVDIDDSFPEYIKENQGILGEWIS